ncbi:hypothetical protein M3Y96_00073500 [Aphelenchoides besseyi]|nr:hypothetical protein M3Y96_00073500 [Aphelenchoides besseyi]
MASSESTAQSPAIGDVVLVAVAVITGLALLATVIGAVVWCLCYNKTEAQPPKNEKKNAKRKGDAKADGNKKKARKHKSKHKSKRKSNQWPTEVADEFEPANSGDPKEDYPSERIKHLKSKKETEIAKMKIESKPQVPKKLDAKKRVEESIKGTTMAKKQTEDEDADNALPALRPQQPVHAAHKRKNVRVKEPKQRASKPMVLRVRISAPSQSEEPRTSPSVPSRSSGGPRQNQQPSVQPVNRVEYKDSVAVQLL